MIFGLLQVGKELSPAKPWKLQPQVKSALSLDLGLDLGLGLDLDFQSIQTVLLTATRIIDFIGFPPVYLSWYQLNLDK